MNQHEWAYTKTRWTEHGNAVRESRCMHCKCRKLTYFNGTGNHMYHVPGGTLTKVIPLCPGTSQRDRPAQPADQRHSIESKMVAPKAPVITPISMVAPKAPVTIAVPQSNSTPTRK
jgi:hypothetical protein